MVALILALDDHPEEMIDITSPTTPFSARAPTIFATPPDPPPTHVMKMPRSAAAKQKMMEAIQRRDEHVRAHAAASLAAMVANGAQLDANGAQLDANGARLDSNGARLDANGARITNILDTINAVTEGHQDMVANLGTRRPS
jgi:hypothetical protein